MYKRRAANMIAALRFWHDGHVTHLWWKSTWGVVADEPHNDASLG